MISSCEASRDNVHPIGMNPLMVAFIDGNSGSRDVSLNAVVTPFGGDMNLPCLSLKTDYIPATKFSFEAHKLFGELTRDMQQPAQGPDVRRAS